MVVEDDEAVRAAVTDMLNELGYAVIRAENAEAALALLRDGATADVLFSDVVMPGPLNTREFARLAKEMLPDIHILFTSGYTHNAIVHNGRLDEGVELLSKPYRKDELARKLHELLGMRTELADGPMVPQSSLPAPAGKKILVVEDSSLIRMTTIDMVEEIGRPYREAANASEALSILESDSDIDVLLTDLGLPGLSGADLIQQACKLRPHLKVIVASGYSEEAGQSLPSEAMWLQKPFTLEQLRAALE
jgi:hypothetical protein